MEMLFVCTGNTCRSPVAAAYLESLRPHWRCRSAGLTVHAGAPVSKGAAMVASRRGLDLSLHEARDVRSLLDHSFVWVFAMTRAHVHQLRALGASWEPRRLGDYLTPPGDVYDPFGGGIRKYGTALEQITEAVDGFLRAERL